MKLKNLIFIGVVLLVSGILLRIFGDCYPLALALILSGIACKLTYVVSCVVNKTYKPGKELFLIYGGLAIFFTGLYLRRHGADIGPVLMGIGIVMKLSFIVLFIRIMRVHK